MNYAGACIRFDNVSSRTDACALAVEGNQCVLRGTAEIAGVKFGNDCAPGQRYTKISGGLCKQAWEGVSHSDISDISVARYGCGSTAGRIRSRAVKAGEPIGTDARANAVRNDIGASIQARQLVLTLLFSRSLRVSVVILSANNKKFDRNDDGSSDQNDDDHKNQDESPHW